MEIRNYTPHTPDHKEGFDPVRRRILAAFAGGATLAITGCGVGDTDHTPEQFAKEPSWRQDFSAMPDGPIDPSVWNTKLGPEGGQGAGQQVYTNHAENIAIRHGAMIVTGLEQQIEGRSFSSARVDTLGKKDFGYGKLVIRAKLPKGVGPHAAGWMRHVSQEPGTPTRNGEIDIFEHVGVNGDKVYPNVHTFDTVSTQANGLVTDHSGVLVPGASDGFHDYGMERTPAGIVFTIDGRETARVTPPSTGASDPQTWPFGRDDHYYLIFNMAIGDNWGGKAGVDKTSDPWEMAIQDIAFYDYVGA